MRQDRKQDRNTDTTGTPGASPSSVGTRVPAGRWQPPSWTDSRLIIGLILIVASVLFGSKLLARDEPAFQVYQAVRALVPGQGFESSQVRVVAVDVGPAAPTYLGADRPLPPSAVVLREVRAGELLPKDAVGESSRSRLKPLVLPVDVDTAAVLSTGTVVDVWVNRRTSTSGPDPATVGYGVPSRLLTAVPVSRATDAHTARVNGVRATVGIQVMVPAEAVEQLVAAVDQGAKITLVPTIGSAQQGPG